MKKTMSNGLVILGAILTLTLSAGAVASDDKRYRIKYKEGNAEAAETLVKSLKAKKMKRRGRSSRRLLAADLNSNQLEALKKSDLVESVELDPRRYPMVETVPYGVTMVQATQLLSDTAVPRKICIIDSGYDASHEDLPGLTSNRVEGHSQIPGEVWSEDGNGHGTHVAGTIAALSGNDTGVVGVHPSPSLSLHIIKIFDNNGLWDTFASDLIDAVDRCVAAGSHVISMSLGGSGSSAAEREAFEDAAASGVVLVAAAGNSGNSSYSYPASYDSVISVAAIDSNRNLANFSQTNDQVELAAPGVAVRSTLPGNAYAEYSGTSMATPHVSAVAGLLWGLNPGCTAQQIRNHLGSTAMDLGNPGRDAQFGYGLIQLQDADANIQQNGCAVPPPPGKFTLQNGQTVTNLSGSTGQTFEFQLLIEEGDSDLLVYIDGANGDADLYLREGAAPTLSVWDCRPWLAGSNEQCGVTLPAPGLYHGMVHAYSSYSGLNLTATWETTTVPPQNTPPTAVIRASAQTGPAPLAVEFDSSESSDDQGVVDRRWNLGDGTEISGPVLVTHTYTSPGTYLAELTVFDEQGESSSNQVAITVNENLAPNASFTASGEMTAETTVNFDASASADPDGDIVSWTWDFGDGDSGSGSSVDHVYAGAGSYNVSLTVTDDLGASSAVTQTLVISEPPEPPTLEIEVSTSLNKRGTRMIVLWTGATTNKVAIYKNGTRITRTRNDGRWADRDPVSGATYVVCNLNSITECSGPLP